MRTAQSRTLIAAGAFAALAPATGALAQSIQLEQIAFVERVSHDGGDRSVRREAASLDARREPARHTDAAAPAQARRAGGPR